MLLLAHGSVGGRGDVARLRRAVRAQGGAEFWFFHRMEAVVLTMLEGWQDLGEVLPPLERVAARGSPYLGALLEAIREEMGATRGGPAPTHGRLRELGYAAWSQLLAQRPAAAPVGDHPRRIRHGGALELEPVTKVTASPSRGADSETVRSPAGERTGFQKRD